VSKTSKCRRLFHTQYETGNVAYVIGRVPSVYETAEEEKRKREREEKQHKTHVPIIMRREGNTKKHNISTINLGERSSIIY
jgi:hypothetical protein